MIPLKRRNEAEAMHLDLARFDVAIWVKLYPRYGKNNHNTES